MPPTPRGFRSFSSGAIPAIVYCVRLLRKNHTGGNFLLPSMVPYLFLALLMGVLWFGSVVLYGWAPCGSARWARFWVGRCLW